MTRHHDALMLDLGRPSGLSFLDANRWHTRTAGIAAEPTAGIAVAIMAGETW
jgi:hypothetical protein